MFEVEINIEDIGIQLDLPVVAIADAFPIRCRLGHGCHTGESCEPSIMGERSEILRDVAPESDDLVCHWIHMKTK